VAVATGSSVEVATGATTGSVMVGAGVGSVVTVGEGCGVAVGGTGVGATSVTVASSAEMRCNVTPSGTIVCNVTWWSPTSRPETFAIMRMSAGVIRFSRLKEPSRVTSTRSGEMKAV
jgi:hypothetical protein